MNVITGWVDIVIEFDFMLVEYYIFFGDGCLFLYDYCIITGRDLCICYNVYVGYWWLICCKGLISK